MRTEASGDAAAPALVQPLNPVSGRLPIAPSILISLSSFGAAEVRRHGQLWFSELSLAAGADGVEVRSELLVDPARELPLIGQAVRTAGKGLVYSSAEPLWLTDGALDLQALEAALAATEVLGATHMKLAIGGFGSGSRATLICLQERLQTANAELVIENDQTPQAGTLTAMQDFFATANALGFCIGMTFDVGNWHWTGECPLQAAVTLAPQVRYVHCKGVQRMSQRWVAVPLAESCAPWRAVLRALPADVPRAIEYPLAGDDLFAVTQREIEQLRVISATLAMASRTEIQAVSPTSQGVAT